MNRTRALATGALMVISGAAYADVTLTPAIVSDYDFRGISQTQEDPALQLGLDYSFDSGFYVGAWGSNVDFGPGDPNMEMDLSAGFAGGDAQNGFAYDVGMVGYLYPGLSDLNTLEVYAGVEKGMFGVKAWVSPDYNGTGESAYYLEGNMTAPLAPGFSFVGHAGWSDGGAWDYVGGYYDWSVGVDYELRNVKLGLKYVDGDSKVVDGRLVASVSMTLPWSAP